MVAFLSSLAFAALPATFSLFADRVLFSGPAVPGARAAVYRLDADLSTASCRCSPSWRCSNRWSSGSESGGCLCSGRYRWWSAFFGIATIDSAILVTLLFAPYAFGQGVSQPAMQSMLTLYGGARKPRPASGYLPIRPQPGADLRTAVGWLRLHEHQPAGGIYCGRIYRLAGPMHSRLSAAPARSGSCNSGHAACSHPGELTQG